LVAVGMPVMLLMPESSNAPATAAAGQPPLAAPPSPTLAAAFDRTLFGSAPAEAEAPVDAPALVGIVGRLDQDAVAMVRTADGSSRTLRIGESVDGWKLESLAIDAAFFTRGTERVRVPLPPA
jgi:hypothetical protein